jgi:signal transduction histidine kinase
VGQHIEEQRTIKSPAEIAAIRASVSTNSQAFEQALRHARPGMAESDLAAEIDYRMRRLGGEKPAFETIVAAGANSALPHANPGPGPLRGLVVVDMGVMRDGYASDCRWHLRKDGSRVWVDGIMRRLDDEEGNLRGFAKVARDATEQREAQEALKRTQNELEERVRQRTAQLWTSNAELQDEISRRERLEQEILDISEREKRRIGQDLHDTLCQELTAAAFMLQTTAKKLEEKKASESKEVGEAAKIVNANVGLARDLARGLHPVEISASGLSTALSELAFLTSTEVPCRFEAPRPVRIRDQNVALVLYRIAQEAVKNSAKHAKAEAIVISLQRNRHGIELTIADNGDGLHAKKNVKGMGLHLMEYRARNLGGTLRVEPNSPKGTRVICTVPSRK